MLDISEIPDKKYLTIGEVSKYSGIAPHTLRYWEENFNLLCPIRKNSKQRLYRKEDLYLIDEIKDLLYNKRYSIEGVKKHFAISKSAQGAAQIDGQKLLKEIYNDLQQILKLLKRSRD